MNVMITGGTSGMGLAAARLFLKRGHSVLCVDMNEERGKKVVETLRRETEQPVFFCAADVTDGEAVRRVHEYAKKYIGFIHCVINNAGIFTGGMLHETAEKDWERVFAVDVKSVFLTSKYFVPDMIENGGGTIVNTASVSGMAGDYNMAAYNAAKGALVNLVRAMALDYGKYNIRVNNVCPAACATPMFLSNPPEVIRQFQNANPLRRICTPEEVAEAMYFLATDASRSCNGINLEVTGGLNVHTGQPAQ